MWVSALTCNQHHCMACSVACSIITFNVPYYMLVSTFGAHGHIFCTTPMAFYYCQGIRGPGLKHLTPQTPWAYCEINGDSGITVRKEGKTIVPYYWLRLAEGRPLLDPQVGESLNPVVSCQPSTNCAKSTFSEGDIFHLPTPTTVDNRLRYIEVFRSELSTKKCTER